jgi:gluconokinase
MASGTGLLDLATGDWDPELLGILGLGEDHFPPISDEPQDGWHPALLDAVCSNLGAGCVGRHRAALMIGTSGALRLLYASEQPRPKPGLFIYRLDAHRVLEGGALSDGGNLYAWLRKTLAVAEGPLLDRSPDEHGLTFLPFLGGERSTGWNPDATGSVSGLTFDTTADDIRQAALEGVAFRFAAIADLLPGLEDVVATGGALLAHPEWIQVIADALARPVTVSAVKEGSLRGAAVAVLERLGYEAASAPLGNTFQPREALAEAYRSARERHRRLYEELRGED